MRYGRDRGWPSLYGTPGACCDSHRGASPGASALQASMRKGASSAFGRGQDEPAAEHRRRGIAAAE